MSQSRDKTRSINKGLLSAGVLLVVVAVLLFWLGAGLFQGLGADFSFTELIRSWGNWGVAGSVGLMALHSFVPFPAEALAMANGMVFGFFWGTVITWCGAMLGALLAFALARMLGQRFVRRMLREKSWQTLERWSLQHGWHTLLLVRFIPVIAFNLINYMAGLTTVSLWTFVWTTAVGILPLTVLCVWMGEQLTQQPLWVWGLLALGLLCSAYLLHRVSLKSSIVAGGAEKGAGDGTDKEAAGADKD